MANEFEKASARLKQNLSSFNSKWTQLAPHLGAIDPEVTRSILDYDRDKVIKGGSGLTMNQTARAILAAQRGRTVTERPKQEEGAWYDPRTWLKGAAHDVGDIVSAPFTPQFWNHLADAGQTLAFLTSGGNAFADDTGVQAMNDRILHAGSQFWADVTGKQSAYEPTAGGPEVKVQPKGRWQAIGDLLGIAQEAPILQFVPGVQTASAILPGGAPAGQAIQHPVMTALDVLPIATTGASLSKAGKAAVAAEAAARDTARLGAGTARRTALKGALTRTVNEEGQLVPNAVGEAIATAAKTPTGAALGKAMEGPRSAFGKVARAISTQSSDWGAGLSAAVLDINESRVPKPIRDLVGYRAVRDLVGDEAAKGIAIPLAKRYGIAEERIAPLTELAKHATDETLRALDDNEFSYLQKVRDITNEFGEADVQRGFLFRDPNSGELIHPDQYKRYASYADRVTRATGRIQGRWGSIVEDLNLFDWATDPRYARLQEAAGPVVEGRATAAQARAFADEIQYLSMHRITPGYSTMGKKPGFGHTAYGEKGLVRGDVWGNLRKDARILATELKRQENYNPMPARWGPAVAKKVEEEVMSRIDDPAKAAEAIAHWEGRRYEEAIIPDADTRAKIDAGEINEARWRKQQLNQIVAEETRGWLKLKEAGGDPIFVHRVSPIQARQMAVGRVAGRITKESHLLERQVLPRGSYIENLDVAMAHQGYEILRTQLQEVFAEAITRMHGRDLDSVRAEFMPYARARIERMGGTEADITDLVSKWVEDRFDKLEPRTMFGVETVRRAGEVYNPETTLVPKHVGKVIRALNKTDRNMLQITLDPITNLYRVAVTGLSPRTQLNNVVGNFVMTAVEDPRAFRHIRQAIKMTRNASDLDQVMRDVLTRRGHSLEAIEEVLNSPQFQNFRNEFQSLTRDQKELAMYEVAAGTKLRQLWDQFGETRVGQKLAKVPHAGLTANGFVDDMNRSLNVFQKLDRELKRGVSPEAAMDEALMLGRKVAMNWRALTPFERSVIRPLVPFYSWLRHITSYAMQFPMDHPLRASILANAVGPEWEDEQSGIPQQLRSVFFFGAGPGKQTGIPVGGFNPYQSVGTAWGLLGFLTGDTAAAGEAYGSINPLIKAVMEQLGIDPRSGQTDMFPDTDVDPRTGRLVAKAPNIAKQVATNLIPQLQLIPGLDTAIEETARTTNVTDPGAATRAMFSAVGLPNLVREYNTPLQYGKQEVALMKDQAEAFNNALLKGNLSEAEKWPGLAPALDVLRQMQESGQLPSGPVTNPQQRALLARNLPNAARQQASLRRQVAAQGT